MKSAMKWGIPIAGTNEKFHGARDAHPSRFCYSPWSVQQLWRKKIRGLCLLCAVLLLALSYLYATWEKHPKMTAFSSGTDGDFSTLRKKNLCVPIVFLRVRLHVWYIAHLSINGSISRRFVSIASTLCMAAWFYFVYVSDTAISQVCIMICFHVLYIL